MFKRVFLVVAFFVLLVLPSFTSYASLSVDSQSFINGTLSWSDKSWYQNTILGTEYSESHSTSGDSTHIYTSNYYGYVLGVTGSIWAINNASDILYCSLQLSNFSHTGSNIVNYYISIAPVRSQYSLNDFVQTSLLSNGTISLNVPTGKQYVFVIWCYGYDKYYGTTRDTTYNTGSLTYRCDYYFMSDHSRVTTTDLNNATSSINNNVTSNSDRVINNATSNTDRTISYMDTWNSSESTSVTNGQSTFNSSTGSYDAQEAALINSGGTNIDSFNFTSLTTNNSVLQGITLSTSFLQSLFVNLGVYGLLIGVSLSCTLAFLIVGWYKFR